MAAKNQAVTNLKNTIFGFKHLLGRPFDDPMVQQNINRAPFKLTKTKNGGIGIVVSYLGEEQTFTPEQITAMLLTKLKETAEEGIKAKVYDCVISVGFVCLYSFLNIASFNANYDRKSRYHPILRKRKG